MERIDTPVNPPPPIVTPSWAARVVVVLAFPLFPRVDGERKGCGKKGLSFRLWKLIGEVDPCLKTKCDRLKAKGPGSREVIPAGGGGGGHGIEEEEGADARRPSPRTAASRRHFLGGVFSFVRAHLFPIFVISRVTDRPPGHFFGVSSQQRIRPSTPTTSCIATAC